MQAIVLSGTVGLLLGSVFLGLSPKPAAAEEPPAGQTVVSLERPQWKVGDNWIVETLTERVQGREDKPATKPTRLRWQFRVVNHENVAGSECYRIDVECLAKGRLRPKTSFWCDRKTLFLRQFQTQFAFNGRYRTIQESYDIPQGQYAPVMASVNVLPIGIPAFLPKGAKGGDTFTYISQPLPAGSKDPSIIRFAHTVKQEIRPAGAKALEQVPPAYAKSLAREPVDEVRLTDRHRTVVQLWQKNAPWPVYVKNGPTQAWLVKKTTP